MEPVEMVVQRAATTIAKLHPIRNETVLKFEDVETIRECWQSAGWMGVPSNEFRRQVIDYALFNILKIDNGDEITPEWHELYDLVQKMLGFEPK